MPFESRVCLRTGRAGLYAWCLTLPRLRIEGELGRRAEGFHDLMNGVGAHEIIAETPRHDRSLHELEIQEICDVIRAYLARIVDLEGDKRMRYVLIFKNHGEEAGAHTISHSISQLMALSVTPRTVKTKLITARDYFALKERCIYCDVLQQELKQKKRLIAENEDFVAFAPFASRFPFEMAVFPKAHNSAFSHVSPTQIESLARILRDVLQRLDHTLGGPPYNLSLQDRPFLRPSRFEAEAVPRNSLVSTGQPDKKKACVEKTAAVGCVQLRKPRAASTPRPPLASSSCHDR